MKKKVLVVTSTFPRWENDADPPFVYELSRRLTDLFDVTVHTPHYTAARTREIMGGVKVHRFRYFFETIEKLAGSTGILPTLRQNKSYFALIPFFLSAQLFSLLKLIGKSRPDVIHAHWLFPQGFFAVIARAFFNVPVVITGHGADIFSLKGWLFLKIKQFTAARADFITVVSRSLRDHLEKMVPGCSHMAVIPMGVDSGTFRPHRENIEAIRKKYDVRDIFLLYVGRLTEKKGVRYLIDAFPKVIKAYPKVKLLVVGDGEIKESLEHQVLRLGLEDYIIFTGSIPNKKLPDYYAAADIFIGPSIETDDGDNEGFGLTFVEASMSGCLVIGTNAGGIGDVIQDGVTGFLVPQKDSGALAEKIIYAIEHRDEREKLARRARQWCRERFDWSIIAGRYGALLTRLIK